MPKRYTVTAALPYTNGPIHIGHLAGVYIPADIYSRYLRAKGEDVAFICGSDEHGVAIALKAKKEGKTPRQIIDHYDQLIRNSFNSFGITFDHYSRTSREIHHKTAQEFFKILSALLVKGKCPSVEVTLEAVKDSFNRLFIFSRSQPTAIRVFDALPFESLIIANSKCSEPT